MNEQHIIVAEANDTLRILIAEYLAQQGYITHEAKDGEQVMKILERQHIDLVLTDSHLPLSDAIELLTQLRGQENKVPVFIISTHNQKDEILRAYAAGADDYVLKPFSIDILTCRIRALLNRLKIHNESLQTIFEFGQCRFDSNTLTLTQDDISITLAPRANEILLLLARNKGQIVSRQQILNTVWGNSDIFTSKSLNVYIAHLRHDLMNFPTLKLTTLASKGYKLTVSDK